MSCSATNNSTNFETVVIGTQTWMARNYDFGGTYPDNDEANVTDYGRLYTWAEANAIDIPGWHLPTNDEFYTLVTYLGGYSVAGGNLKEEGTTHWTTPNTGATDSVNFTAVGAGLDEGNFKSYARFWGESATVDNAYYLSLVYNDVAAAISSGPKTQRFSVRLIKD